MQALPLNVVDMMSAGSPATSTSTADTGQAGVFATKLAVASKGQAMAAPQAKGLSKQKTNGAPAKQTPATADDQTAQVTLTVALSTTETNNAPAGQTPTTADDLIAQFTGTLHIKGAGPALSGKIPASDEDSDHDDATNALASGATLNNAAGAANMETTPVFWSDADSSFTPNQNITVKVLTSEPVASQILNTIILASKGLMGTAQTNSPTPPTSGTTVAPAANEATAPAISTETQPPLLTTTPLADAPAGTGVLATPNASSSVVSTGVPQKELTGLQPQITVSVTPDPTPAVAPAGLTEPTPTATATPSITPQIPSAADQTAVSQTAASQAGADQTAVQQIATLQGTADQIVQNTYGQLLTIYQSGELKDIAVPVGDLNKPLTTGTGNQSLDVSNNFVSSHRPNDAPKAMEKESGNHQQETTAKDNQEKVATTAKAVTNGQQQAEQFVSQSPQGAQVTAGTGTENQVFLTPHPQASAPLAGNAPMTDGATVRLPSGLAVPGEAVVDQMIAHFSVNKRLESGTVSLKLNPQELGELRMEIKVSQDNIKAHIIAQNPQAQEMIGLHLPRLREALEQQGLHLQQVEVTIAANDNTSREQYQGNTGRQQLNQSGHNSRPVFSLDTGEDSGESVHSSNKLSVLA